MYIYYILAGFCHVKVLESPSREKVERVEAVEQEFYSALSGE